MNRKKPFKFPGLSDKSEFRISIADSSPPSYGVVTIVVVVVVVVVAVVLIICSGDVMKSLLETRGIRRERNSFSCDRIMSPARGFQAQVEDFIAE